MLLGHRIIADCVLVGFCKLFSLGYCDDWVIWRGNSPIWVQNLSTKHFFGTRSWKRKWNWMKLKYVTLVGLILSLVPLGMSPVTSYILKSSLLNNTNNCSNCIILSFIWMICMFNMAVSAKILIIPWKVKYFWLTRGGGLLTCHVV